MSVTPFTVPIPDDLLPFLDRAAQGDIGGYLCGLVRDAQVKARSTRLEALLHEGLASEPLPFDATFVAALTEQIACIVAGPARP
ncbi:MAG: hypothetical protein WCI94_04720 [Rhodospirillales bacterium]